MGKKGYNNRIKYFDVGHVKCIHHNGSTVAVELQEVWPDLLSDKICYAKGDML
jgi:hypothetical protein